MNLLNRYLTGRRFLLLTVFCLVLRSVMHVAAQPTEIGAYQITRTSESNVDFFTTNYGIFGLDILNGRSGLIWPASTTRRYLFGAGFWFGVRKYVADSGRLVPLVLMGYNPNSGASEFTPGRAGDATADEGVDDSERGIGLNRLYNSTDHDRLTGALLENPDAWPLWPVWLDPVLEAANPMYAGSFLPEPEQRLDAESNGWSPAFFVDQEFFSVYRDNDLSRYQVGAANAAALGYPLGIEVQSRVFAWADGRAKDAVILTYAFINRSNDTLHDCYFSPVLDPDVGQATNDRVSTVIAERALDTLNMAQAWSESSNGDNAYGYFGIDMLATPAVDGAGFLRTDRPFYPPEEQVGLSSVRNWVIDNDPRTIPERYEFMSTDYFDGDNGAGDKRILISSGPFSMAPGDTARFAVALLFAEGTHTIRTGTDNENLIALSSWLQQRFDRGMRAVSSVRQLGEIIRRLNLE